MGRLHNLDYLRGLAAFGIMIYHFLTWTFGRFTSESIMGRVGMYGVSIFYVLSGLTLFFVYHQKMVPNSSDIKDFVIKRVFRIFPLLWLATFASIPIFLGEMPDMKHLMLNLTGLFGFVAWDKAIGIGVWSIGNELVFYVFLPLFVLLSKKFKPGFITLAIVLFSIYCYFAFFLLDSTKSIGAEGQQHNYINPLNQVFLFLGGYLIGLLFRNVTFSRLLNFSLLISGLLIFIFYPASGDTIHLITGFGRLAFTLSCFLICLSFYKLTFSLPGIVHKSLKLLGEASYSVYLLHPIMHFVAGLFIVFLDKHVMHFPESVRFVLAVVMTLSGSYFVYKYFEQFFIRLGKRLTEKTK